jgi:nucleoid DNA-binding protein
MDRINAEFLPDMGELFWIREAAIRHHRMQRSEASLCEEQPWQAPLCIEPHQPALYQPLRNRCNLRLACLWAAAPGFQMEPLRYARQSREEPVEFPADVVPLAGREPGDHPVLRLVHDRDVAHPGSAGSRAAVIAGPQLRWDFVLPPKDPPGAMVAMSSFLMSRHPIQGFWNSLEEVDQKQAEASIVSKAFIASVIRGSTEITGVAANRAATDLIEAIVRELKKNGKFTLPSFGTFRCASRAATILYGKEPVWGPILA